MKHQRNSIDGFNYPPAVLMDVPGVGAARLDAEAAAALAPAAAAAAAFHGVPTYVTNRLKVAAHIHILSLHLGNFNGLEVRDRAGQTDSR